MTRRGQSFDAWQRNTKRVKIQVYDKDDAPYDLTGAVITWFMQDTSDEDETPILTKTSAPSGGIEIGSPATAGYFVVLLSAAELDLPARGYYHEARILDVAGHQETVTIGHMTLHPAAI